jgi:DNA-binding response OmpR family regulator
MLLERPGEVLTREEISRELRGQSHPRSHR